MKCFFRISRSGQLGAERSRAAAASGVQLEGGTARGEEFKVRKGYSNAISEMQSEVQSEMQYLKCNI